MTVARPARDPAASPAPGDGSAMSAAGAAFALALGFAAAAVAVLAAAVPLTGVGPGRGVAVIFVLTFGALLPAAVATALRIARSAFRRPGGVVLPVAAAGLGSMLALLFAAGRVVYEIDHSFPTTRALLLPGVALWGLGTALALRRVLRARSWSGPPAGRYAWGAIAVSLTAGALAFVPTTLLGVTQLAPAIGAALLLAAVCLAAGRAVPSSKARWVIDLGAVALIVLVANDLGFLTDIDFLRFRGQVHQDFYLAPINEMLGGHPMLVDSVSQYGVGSLYFLAGLFELVPVGYGTLGLLSSLLTSLQLCALYSILRLGGCSQATSVAALAVAIAACLFGGLASPSIWPSTGALRYGLPYLLVLVAVVAAHRPRPGRVVRTAPYVLVALACLWSAETFLYTAVVYAAIALFDAATRERGQRARPLVRRLVLAAVACVVVQALYALLTLALAGSWPDWGAYLSLLGVYDDAQVAYLIATLPQWSPAMILGAGYFASAAALGIVATACPRLATRHRATFTALVGVTALGAITLTGYLGKPQYWILHNVAIPAVALGPLWLATMERAGLPRRALTAALVATCCLAGLAVVSAWPTAERHWPRTPLGLTVVHGRSVRFELNNIRARPPVDPLAAEGERLVRTYMPGDGPVLVLPQASQELATEILVRAQRPNALPISHPSQDLLLPERSRPRIRAAIDRLRPGTRMLVDSAPPPQDSVDIPGRVPLQTSAIRRVERRFRLEVVARGRDGMAVVRLVPSRHGAR